MTTARGTTLSLDGPAFDPTRAYGMSPQVAIRPEPFGGLAYDYDSRRLTLIASPALVDVLHALAAHPTARAAIAACVPAGERARLERALAGLHGSGVIRAR